MTQHLVARIKRSSKYAYQAPDGGWFDVNFVGGGSGYTILGNANRYRVCDLMFGMRLDDGAVIDLVGGKMRPQESLEATS